jgi:hypothetical protein
MSDRTGVTFDAQRQCQDGARGFVIVDDEDASVVHPVNAHYSEGDDRSPSQSEPFQDEVGRPIKLLESQDSIAEEKPGRQ